MIRELEYYSAIPLIRVERYCDQMEKECGEIRERYGVDAPDYGKPLEPHHQRILDRFVKNIQVLCREPSMKGQISSHPLREYTVISRLDRFEQEIHPFRESFLRHESPDTPGQEQGVRDARHRTGGRSPPLSRMPSRSTLMDRKYPGSLRQPIHHIRRIAVRDPDRCEFCEICETLVPCARAESRRVEDCTGCGACAAACPQEAIRMEEGEGAGMVTVTVDGEGVAVPAGVTVQQALEYLGHTFGRFPGEGDHFAPCRTGGCGACALAIDGALRQSCITPVRDGMEIRTELPAGTFPLRAVTGWTGHGVGGVGTPWQLQGSRPLIEAAVFACGCNLRCPQCQNWTVTYRGVEPPLTPREAAVRMTVERRRLGVSRMAISGGEATLNRPWLLRYLEELLRLNPDPGARFHVDTNATILSRDYLDSLVEAGMTDIGPDLKGLRTETFIAITGISDTGLATRYLRTSWDAVRYLSDRYSGRIFMGVGIPYHPLLIPREEITRMGDALCRIDPGIQVTVLDYRPAFRRRDLARPAVQEMREVRALLTGTGLRMVISQTAAGPLGP